MTLNDSEFDFRKSLDTLFNIIACTANAKILYKKPYQTFLGLNLKAGDYQYLTKLWNISS